MTNTEHAVALAAELRARGQRALSAYAETIATYQRATAAVAHAAVAIEMHDYRAASAHLAEVPGHMRDEHWHALRRAAAPGEVEDETPTLRPPAPGGAV